jgi:hypothetical protein
LFETYYVAPALTCWTEIAGRIAIPPGCKYFTNVLEGIIGT